MKKLLILCIILLINFAVTAHPHMFIDSKVSFEFSDTELKGFWVTWYFDEMFTEGILMDYDINNDYVFDVEESLCVESGAFANLENYNYFLFVNNDGIEKKIKSVSNFKVDYIDGRLVYNFFVPCEVNITKLKKQVKVSIYDESFFCDIAYIKKNPVTFTNNSSVNTSYRIDKNTEKEILYSNASTVGGRSGINYSGQVFPDEIVLELSLK